MDIRRHLRVLAICVSLSLIALPYAAEAKCGMKRATMSSCMSGCKGGMIYNENTGMYQSLCSKCRGMVYRSVDGKYIPVGKMASRYCKKDCSHMVVGVKCQTKPGYWWGYTWFGPSNECWYMVR